MKSFLLIIFVYLNRNVNCQNVSQPERTLDTKINDLSKSALQDFNCFLTKLKHDFIEEPKKLSIRKFILPEALNLENIRKKFHNSVVRTKIRRMKDMLYVWFIWKWEWNSRCTLTNETIPWKTILCYFIIDIIWLCLLCCTYECCLFPFLLVDLLCWL